jgi:hypothetical protein
MRLFGILEYWNIGIKAKKSLNNHSSIIPSFHSYPPSNILPFVKKVPATHAVSRQAKVAATSALIAILERVCVLFGAKADTPPTKMAIDATWAKPQRA